LPHFPIFAQTADSVDTLVKIAICGNVIIEKPAEDCEGIDLDGETCESLGFKSGTLSCDISCEFETSLCVLPVCGDGSVDPGEECDGSDLGGETCESLGFQSGTLSCNIACEFETALCVPFPVPSCGDGTLDAGEECEVGNPFGNSCDWTSCNETTCVCEEDEEEDEDEDQTPFEDLFIGPGDAPSFISILSDALMYYDLNGDGVIDLDEIEPAVELWVNIWRNVLYDESEATCDLNNDGECDIYDFSILMYYVGK
jgi:hypothetical protein